MIFVNGLLKFLFQDHLGVKLPQLISMPKINYRVVITLFIECGQCGGWGTKRVIDLIIFLVIIKCAPIFHLIIISHKENDQVYD